MAAIKEVGWAITSHGFQEMHHKQTHSSQNKWHALIYMHVHVPYASSDAHHIVSLQLLRIPSVALYSSTLSLKHSSSSSFFLVPLNKVSYLCGQIRSR